MTTFQIIMVIISLITIAGGLIALYVSNQTDVTKIKVEMLELRNLINVNTRDIETIRKENREDHGLMFSKMDDIKEDHRKILVKQSEILVAIKSA